MSDAVKVGFVPFSAASRGILVVFCDDSLKFGAAARKAATTHEYDFMEAYVRDLPTMSSQPTPMSTSGARQSSRAPPPRMAPPSYRPSSMRSAAICPACVMAS